jgi:hypothetical protein
MSYVPGKALIELVRKNHETSRRDALIGLGESLVAAVGIASGVKFLSQSEPDFDELVEILGSRYKIGQAQKNGEKTVVYLEDVHYPEIARRNIDKLKYMKDNCQLKLIGLEGVVEEGIVETNRLRSMFNQKYLTFSDDEVYNIQDRSGKALKAKAFGSYRPLFLWDEIDVVGLEDRNNYDATQLGGEAYEFYTDLFEAARMGAYAPLEVDGKPAVNLRALQVAQEFYKEDPVFPVFDITKVEETKINEDMTARIFSRENGGGHLLECMKKMTEWSNNNLIVSRNIYSANSLMDQMEKRGLNLGAIVYGKLHGRNVKGSSILREFEKRGFNYITLTENYDSGHLERGK